MGKALLHVLPEGTHLPPLPAQMESHSVLQAVEEVRHLTFLIVDPGSASEWAIPSISDAFHVELDGAGVFLLGRRHEVGGLGVGRFVDGYRVTTDMPIHWTIDSQARLLSARIEGDISLDHALAVLEAMSGAGAMSYRKLADCRAGSSSMSAEEILTLCVKIRSYHAQSPVGPLALVVTSAQSWQFARLMGVLAAADRRMRVFEDLRQARLWIKQQHDVQVVAEVHGDG